MRRETVNWTIHIAVLGLAAASIVAYGVYEHRGLSGFAALGVKLVVMIGAGGLVLYALVSTLVLRSFVHRRAAVALVHLALLVPSAAMAAIFVGRASKHGPSAYEKEHAEAEDPRVPALRACLHVRLLTVEAGRGARVSLESVGCPELEIGSLRVEALVGESLSLFGSSYATVVLAPNTTAILATSRRAEAASVAAHSEWQVAIGLAPRGPSNPPSVAFGTPSLWRTSGRLGLIEEVQVLP